MAGDYTRVTFDPYRDHAGVLMQQGRVTLDADWNELVDLVDRRLRAETIEHVRDVQLLLSEVRRVLRPGGTLALTTPAHGRLTGLAVLARGFERSFDPLSPHVRFFTARSLRLRFTSPIVSTARTR